ncbi:hypothetical protein EXIGLDRAFT_719950 [Exidia glandulosa HHB12029]|uniref:DUF6830 domain-containing protein n=1 Tax=Exidia glandulosa HHB12029 TaxID=1314781 RepID=A0A165GPQ0_EXIGL|nr:hypothetical protein EXIGLDRAFT_719950 [Exidia glandulosa HHB12029]
MPSESAHMLTQVPSLKRRSVTSISELFGLPNLAHDLAVYLAKQLNPNATRQQLQNARLPLSWMYLDVWYRSRVQLPVLDVQDKALQRETILAHPGSNDARTPARYHAVFIDSDPDSTTPQGGLQGFDVAQIRLIFCSSDLRRAAAKKDSEPAPRADVLAYVHEFSFGRSRASHPDLVFYAADRARDRTTRAPKGAIYPLDHVAQPCPLTPRFNGPAADLGVTNDDCLELCDEFWINSFHTQHTYQSVY